LQRRSAPLARQDGDDLPSLGHLASMA
jgi:hypothetical protein